MNPNRLIVFILLVITVSCTTNNEYRTKSFVLKGELVEEVAVTRALTLRYWTGSTYQTDTALVKNGSFIFRGKIREPLRADIISGSDFARIYIEPGRMKLVLESKNFENFKLTGSDTQNEMNELIALERPLHEKLMPVRELSIAIRDSLKNAGSISKKADLEEQLESIDAKWSAIKNEINMVQLNFILDQPGSYVTPEYLNMLGSNEIISPDSLKSIFLTLDEKIQNSIQGTAIKEKIRKMDNIRVGMLAPAFQATDINQRIVTLSQFKDTNIVLLDFWASWCIPCRKEIPVLKNLYTKYHQEGLVIVAVSLDDDKDAWRSAVKSDGTDQWFHVPVAEEYNKGPAYFTDDDIYTNYFVQAIPVSILIDRNGKIVGRWGGGSGKQEISLEAKLAEIFGK